MTLKFIVAQRIEALAQDGPRTNLVLVGEQAPDKPFAKLELVGLSPDGARHFPLGRKLEVRLQTYNDSDLVIVPGRP